MGRGSRINSTPVCATHLVCSAHMPWGFSFRQYYVFGVLVRRQAGWLLRRRLGGNERVEQGGRIVSELSERHNFSERGSPEKVGKEEGRKGGWSRGRDGGRGEHAREKRQGEPEQPEQPVSEGQDDTERGRRSSCIVRGSESVRGARTGLGEQVRWERAAEAAPQKKLKGFRAGMEEVGKEWAPCGRCECVCGWTAADGSNGVLLGGGDFVTCAGDYRNCLVLASVCAAGFLFFALVPGDGVFFFPR